jgi:hypothetical protein
MALNLEKAVQHLLDNPPRHGKNGRDGRDGRDGGVGPRGEPGAVGPPGKSVTVADVAPTLEQLVSTHVARIPPAKDGEPGAPGKDGASVVVEDVRPLVEEEVAARVAEIPRAKDGATGPRGPIGPPGLQGPPGEQGPMPLHEWDGTRLRFTQGPDGKAWGEYVDLIGPKGEPGKRGQTAGGTGLRSGSSTDHAVRVNSWIPGGW